MAKLRNCEWKSRVASSDLCAFIDFYGQIARYTAGDIDLVVLTNGVSRLTLPPLSAVMLKNNF
jgi:hypothetical protein